eukprot:scaffold141417_cov24-Tisochrysis_lutea.AAC.1
MENPGCLIALLRLAALAGQGMGITTSRHQIGSTSSNAAALPMLGRKEVGNLPLSNALRRLSWLRLRSAQCWHI